MLKGGNSRSEFNQHGHRHGGGLPAPISWPPTGLLLVNVMTPVATKRIVPAKVKDTTAKRAVLKKATQTTRPKVKINFVKSVRG
jgi:hypothetical protein